MLIEASSEYEPRRNDPFQKEMFVGIFENDYVSFFTSPPLLLLKLNVDLASFSVGGHSGNNRRLKIELDLKAVCTGHLASLQ